MDDKFKKRIMAFYVAGFLNLALGLYVLINGRALVEQTMWYVLIAFFFSFAAVDFWFARNLRKKWVAAWKEHMAKQGEQGKAEGGRRKAEG
jgi:membrane protein implicated in regulation of membrane protease activity